MDIKLDPITDDIALTADGSMTLTAGAEAVRQRLALSLRFVRGEWFLDRRVGIPYFEDILRKNVSEGVLVSIFREAALLDPEIVSADDFSITYNRVTRIVSITFRALTVLGDVVEFDTELILGGVNV